MGKSILKKNPISAIFILFPLSPGLNVFGHNSCSQVPIEKKLYCDEAH